MICSILSVSWCHNLRELSGCASITLVHTKKRSTNKRGDKDFAQALSSARETRSEGERARDD